MHGKEPRSEALALRVQVEWRIDERRQAFHHFRDVGSESRAIFELGIAQPAENGCRRPS
jgi:hypothetical protein